MLLYLLTALPIFVVLRRTIFKPKPNPIDMPAPITDTTTGKVLGQWGLSSSGTRIFASFLGIPYAKAPTGKLRFRRPEPAEPWAGVRQCTKTKEFVQRNIFAAGTPKVGEEDALIINVYTPNIQGHLPVMVFIHGGGYVSGSGSRAIYGAENFMEKDVILVTFNYRLSVLGGLYLDGTLVPGNQMMRDQVLALRWVQDNIGYFGGDRTRVTIFGESAGGMSVTNHLLSPMSAGLFSAAISQSGAPTTPFAAINKHPAHYGYKLVERLGIDPALPIEQILDELAVLDPIKFQDLGYMFEEFVRAPMPFKPIVDGGLVDDPFLPEEPLELIKKGKYNKVPLIIGTNKDEGLLIKGFYMKNQKNFETGYNNWRTIGPLAFFAKEKDEVTPVESETSEEYLSRHFKEGKFAPKGPASDALVEMYGDVLFAAPCEQTIKAMVKTTDTPIYHYLYAHPGSLSLYELVVLPPWRAALRFLSLYLGANLFSKGEGVCHGDELFLMFKARALPVDAAHTPQDKKVRDLLVDMWTSFATQHDPTPRSKHWTPYNPEQPLYCEITSSGCSMRRSPQYAQRMAEWEQIWSKVPNTMRNTASPTWSKYGKKA